MKNHLRYFKWPQNAHSPRQGTAIALVTVIVFAGLYYWLTESLSKERIKLQTTVTALRAQAAGLEQQAVEFERLGTAPAASTPTGEVAALVQAHAASAGLSRASLRIDSSDKNHVKLVIAGVAFTDWLNMAISLQSMQIRLEECRIEAMSTPGLVSISATFSRAALR